MAWLIAALLATWLPDARVTPGATNPAVRPNTVQATVCSSAWSTRLVRPPARYTTRLKIQQIAVLGLVGQPADYEEDHRVPLEVGGHPTDPRNLWPEPRRGPWNAGMKDRLENAIHRELCAGRLSLAAAQAVFLGADWTVAYRAYLGGLR